MEDQKPKIGIGIMILKDDKVLLGRRKGSHGEGEYAFPGGHLEYMESFEDCAKREVMEEAGIKIKNIAFVRIVNLQDYAPKHYVHIGLTAEWESGEPKVLEPDKCAGWGWYSLDALPSPLFKTLPDDIESYKTGRTYYDVT